MRLNRRGLGTGLLCSRILPAALLLVVAGATVLSLGSHPKGTGAGPVPQFAAFGATPTHANSRPVPASYGHLPLMFEPNQGQTDPRVRFIARGSGYGLFLTDQDAVLSLQRTQPLFCVSPRGWRSVLGAVEAPVVCERRREALRGRRRVGRSHWKGPFLL